jgi:hypothetical protein
MTPFETVLAQAEAGEISTPSVFQGNYYIDYLGYQLATSLFNLSLLSKGMTRRGLRLKDLKEYYGLKGRTAIECLPQLQTIHDNYKTKFLNG